MKSIQMETLGCFFYGLRTWVQSSHTHQVHGFLYVCFRPACMCMKMVSMWRWKQWRRASPNRWMRCRVMGSQFIPCHLWAVVKCHVVQLIDMETFHVLSFLVMLSFGSRGNFPVAWSKVCRLWFYCMGFRADWKAMVALFNLERNYNVNEVWVWKH